MKVRIERADNPHVWYAVKIGQTFTVVDVNGIYVVPEMSEIHTHTILKSDCTVIDEPTNRVPFDYEIWKQKGGKVWCVGKEVTQLRRFEVELGAHKYAGVMDGILKTFSCESLTMSVPDEIKYANVYDDEISDYWGSPEECRRSRSAGALFILEINITKGTCRVVHKY